MQLLSGYNVVGAVDIAIVELEVVEMVFTLLPSANVWRISDEVAVTNFAESSDVLEVENVRVHGGDEQP